MAAGRAAGSRAGAKAPAGAAIDTSQIDVAALPAKEFPAGAGYRVVISAPAHETVWKHATASVEDARASGGTIVEVGGMLVGNIYKDSDGPYLEISAAIVGEHTGNQGTQMTFTPETWAQVNEVKATKYPNEKIVGWYHTHPDFGVFLSDVDKFTHRQYFSPPWTTAFVVDPVRKTEGFFTWSGGETLEVSEYWVGQQRRNRVVVVQQESRKSSESAPSKPPESAVSRAVFALSAVLGVLALLLVFGYVYMREINHSETEKFVVAALEEQRGAIQTSVAELQGLKKEFDANRKQTEDDQKRTVDRIDGMTFRLVALHNQAAALEARIINDERLMVQQVPAQSGPAGPPTPAPAAQKTPQPKATTPSTTPATTTPAKEPAKP